MSLFVAQEMNELNLRDFRHGGVNITGFNLVDVSSASSQTGSALSTYSGSRLTVS